MNCAWYSKRSKNRDEGRTQENGQYTPLNLNMKSAGQLLRGPKYFLGVSFSG